jgi:hypothetical protein
MAILAMPTSPGIQRVRWLLRGQTLKHISPLTRRSQTIEIVGSRWLGTYTLPPMRRSVAEPWMIFLAQLNGRAGRFYGGDPSAASPRGSASGIPTVNGASQVGKSLMTSGWTGGATNVLRAGDFIAWDTPSGWRELHQITADASATAAGQCTVRISPPIRESPAHGATVITTATTCVMQLATDDDGRWEIDDASLYAISFSAEEAFSADLG